MMREEFERLTGIYPTEDMYEAIEEAYMEFNGDKTDFCKAYLKNKDGMAEATQRKADMKKALAQRNEKANAQAAIDNLTEKVVSLTASLEREQEWKPYESEHNVSQSEYERLAQGIPNSSNYMTDEEAIDWVVQETGFAPERVKIVSEIAEEEINRHQQVRQTGKKIDRRPIYCATDYHYIRFTVRANTTNEYELWNDELRACWC